MPKLFGAIAVVALAAGLAISQTAAPYQSAGTKRMAARLAAIFQANDWKTDPFKNRERIAYIRKWLVDNPGSPREWGMRMGLAKQQIELGESGQAVDELENVRKLSAARGGLPTDLERGLHELLGLAYLRVGEQENCIANHNADSCLFPIQGGGIHKSVRGAEGAIREYTAFLQANPADTTVRWLLNIAYMARGKYPGEVPPQWLAPPETFASDYDIKRFRDIAPNVGLDITGHSGGSIAEDFDGDGLIDLMVSSSGPMDQLRFFHNNGDGTFTERTQEAGLIGETGGLNIIHADYNNDGHPDVLVLRGGWWRQNGAYPMSLLRNNGNGTFDDVTVEAGLLSMHPTQAAAWADFDNDGLLDLFVGHEEGEGESHPSCLYHNNGDGTFTDIAAQVGLDHIGYVKGVAWGDFDNDGWPDLYISRNGQANILFHNDGKKRPDGAWSFTDVTAKAGVAEPVYSFATWFWDYDNDGWLDLFVAPFKTPEQGEVGAFELGLPNHAERPRLYHNNHDGTFTDVTQQMRLDRAMLVMGANFGDLDNDGWLDCYLGTGGPDFRNLLPNRMFRNREGKDFQDVTTSGGFGHLQKGHGVSFADFNNDGNLDVFETIGGYYEGDSYQSVLFENPGHGNHWISLDVEGVKSNRSAIGARLRVTVRSASGTREIFREVTSGGSFGDSPFRVHVGLGQATAVPEVQVRWPTSHAVQSFHDLQLDHNYRIREGAAKAEPVVRKAFAFAKTGHAAHVHPQ